MISTKGLLQPLTPVFSIHLQFSLEDILSRRHKSLELRTMNRYGRGPTIGGPSKATATTQCQKCLKRDMYSQVLPLGRKADHEYAIIVTNAKLLLKNGHMFHVLPGHSNF